VSCRAHTNPSIPVCVVAHDDNWFLEAMRASYGAAGPVTVFISRRAWNGAEGPWERVADAAEASRRGGSAVGLADESFYRKKRTGNS
jgi:hypothetical protein